MEPNLSTNEILQEDGHVASCQGLADDDIEAILKVKDQLNDLLESLERMVLGGTLTKVTRNTLMELGIIMHEDLDGFLAADYYDLMGKSRSLFFPDKISHYKRK